MESLKYLKGKLFHLLMERKMRRVRKKDKIRYLFILQELTQWKTETLYQAMLAHPRFEPILGITKCLGYPGAEETVMAYCKEKNYPIEKLAMQFSCSNPRIASTVFSTTRPEAIKKNIAYIEEPMDEQLVQEVRNIIGDQQRVSWANT